MNWWLVFRHTDYFEAIGRPPLLQHTWSLAVEAQFYLFWPLVLLLILKWFGKKRIPGAALTIAAISGITRLATHTDPKVNTNPHFSRNDRIVSGKLCQLGIA
jgi:peptidoglycan/LPS O-acetylase OafA/YrhL